MSQIVGVVQPQAYIENASTNLPVKNALKGYNPILAAPCVLSKVLVCVNKGE